MKELIKDVNKTETCYNSKSLMERFEKSVQEYPERIAVVSANGQVTYGELNQRANAIGHKLQKMGIGRNDVVAVCIERSIEMVVAIYGILKAGAAYLPIDKRIPSERMAYMCRNSESKAVIVLNEEDAEFFEEKVQMTIILEKENLKGNFPDLQIKNEDDDIAYVIYTSGTTGMPKGVMNRHVSLKNRIDWMDEKYPIDMTDVILQKTIYSFDVSVWEIIWWGIKGAKLGLLDNGAEMDFSLMCDRIKQYQITVMHFVPSVFEVFLEYIEENLSEKEELVSLKRIFLSGEVLKVEHVEKFYHIFGKTGAKLINLYGPTEAAIDVTYYECKEKQEIIPIGKPISNIKIHIEKDGKECGVGVPGEICIAGVGLAKGYINNKRLTEEKFVKNPYDGGKMYRSGDLARWLPDGNIEFLGRKDEQIKIRGIRIELKEIENVISKIKGVRQVVLQTKEKEKEKAICAYIVGDEKLSMDSVRNTLRKKLPEYMIPTYMMQIEQVPLTLNGKVDRKNLPEIVIRSEGEYEEPKDLYQKALVKELKKVLKLDKISLKDEFFSIGGNSINATLIAIHLNKAGFNITVKDILSLSALDEIAERMRINDLPDCEI